jgi:hypothetical protein
MKYFLLAGLFIVFSGSRAQSVRDSSFAMNLIGMQVCGQIPVGELASRYGENLAVGLSYHYKTRKNWLFGFDPYYVFGKKIKEDVLAPLRNEEGFVTNSDGNYAAIRLNERAWMLTFSAGKIIPLKFSNPNSGIIALLGAGYLQHKINIYDVDGKVPQLRDEYKKGYDRLTAGPLFREFLGYIYLSNNRLVNFYGGFEFYQGITKSQRSYNIDQNAADTKTHLDMLIGIRLGWVLPVYKREDTSNLFN